MSDLLWLVATRLVNSAAHNLKMPPTSSLHVRRWRQRRELLRHAPPQLQDQEPELPDQARDPDLFAHVMLGIDWVEDIELHVFCVNFLAELKAFRANFIRNL